MAARPPGALEVGRRVFLRAPTARDREEFLALMRVSRTALRPWIAPPASRAAFTAHLRRARRATERAFLVCRLEDRAIAGVINVSQIFHGNFQSAYLGYYAGAPFMGQGYMSEGLRLVLRHAFDTLGLHRLEANIQPRNRASIRLVRRAGFRREGFSPRYLKILGRWRDHERWAITAEARRR
ncbi:MAG TPA: GNAT family protein [Candidatus Binatia bacterium]|nr:GNAT family protein [Candidatus Binatia bacterium]